MRLPVMSTPGSPDASRLTLASRERVGLAHASGVSASLRLITRSSFPRKSLDIGDQLIPGHARRPDSRLVQHLVGDDDVGFLRVVLVERTVSSSSAPHVTHLNVSASYSRYGMP